MTDKSDDETYNAGELGEIFQLADSIATLCDGKKHHLILEALAINFTFHVYKLDPKNRQTCLDVFSNKVLAYCEENDLREGNDALH
jgi:hypothetical protein